MHADILKSPFFFYLDLVCILSNAPRTEESSEGRRADISSTSLRWLFCSREYQLYIPQMTPLWKKDFFWKNISSTSLKWLFCKKKIFFGTKVDVLFFLPFPSVLIFLCALFFPFSLGKKRAHQKRCRAYEQKESHQRVVEHINFKRLSIATLCVCVFFQKGSLATFF